MSGLGRARRSPAVFADPPAFVAFRHAGVREGFEVAFLRQEPEGWVLEGSTSAVEDGEPFVTGYELRLDGIWRTDRALVGAQAGRGRAAL